MTMNVMRFEDMSPDGYLMLHRQQDGDIVLVIHEERRGKGSRSASVEFCTSGGGSRRTLEALYALMGAMAEDNLDASRSHRRPVPTQDEDMNRIVEWVKSAQAARQEIDTMSRDFIYTGNRRAEFFEKLADLLEQYRVEITARDDGASYGMQSPLVGFEFQSPDYSREDVIHMSAQDAKELAEKIRSE